MGITLLVRNDGHGQTAPNHMNTAKFNNISIVGCKESSMVSSRNQSLAASASYSNLESANVLLLREHIAGDEAG